MRREIGIIGMICCIGGAFALGWFVPELIPEEEPSPEVPKIPVRPKEPEIPEEPQEPEEVEEPEEPAIPLVDQIKTRGYINVGTSADYPPYEFVNISTSDIVGFDIDLSDLIAAELNVTLQMTDIPFDSLINACNSSIIDMIAAAMIYTPSRATVLAPSIPYINLTQVVVVKNASGLQISSLDNLTAFFVGCQAGTTQYDALTAIAGFTEGVNLLVYPDADTLMLNLDNGVINAAYVEKPIFTVWSKVYSLKIIFSTGSDSLVLWCRWEEPELQYVINKVIFEAYQTGIIYDLIMTWFG